MPNPMGGGTSWRKSKSSGRMHLITKGGKRLQKRSKVRKALGQAAYAAQQKRDLKQIASVNRMTAAKRGNVKRAITRRRNARARGRRAA